ncbi:MAG: AMP-binding protein [Betaproteobacteria bacterium]
MAGLNAGGARPADTFPLLLLQHAKEQGQRVAMREKDLGIWQSWTWSEAASEVRALACGLAAQGFSRGMNLAIIGDNRPRLYWSFAAAQCLGGVPVPMYQDAVAQELLFVLENAEIEYAIVEDQEQVDKLLDLLPLYPKLKHIFYDEPRGLRHYAQPQLMAYDRLRESGREYDAQKPGFFETSIENVSPQDVCVILYTSGTTSKPKGVCLTHAALICAARGDVELDGFNPSDDVLSYLPMAWVGDHLFSYAQALVAGFTVNCPESADTAMNDLREIGPTYYFAPPRIFENLLTTVMIRMEDASRIKRLLFDYFMTVARRCGAQIMDSKPVGWADRLRYRLGDLLVYGPLRNILGMSRVRVAYTGGAAIGPDLYRFYRSIGINLKQLYGQTETAAYVCKQPNGEAKLDSVGKPMPGVEVRIVESGEIWVKTPSMLKEYYKRPDASAETLSPDGYFMTGDAGFLDEDGHLKIIDRASDVGRLANGTLFAPQFIENKLKFYSYIKEAVCFGDRREMVCAFVNIDLQAVANWAEKRNMPYSGYLDLTGRQAVYDLVSGCVEQVNADLARDDALANSQIRRFLILHKELDADDDELTRTRKVRRKFVAEKYAPLIAALYSGQQHCHIATEVKFEDGRRGTIEADIRIQNVPPAGSGQQAA